VVPVAEALAINVLVLRLRSVTRLVMAVAGAIPLLTRRVEGAPIAAVVKALLVSVGVAVLERHVVDPAVAIDAIVAIHAAVAIAIVAVDVDAPVIHTENAATIYPIPSTLAAPLPSELGMSRAVAAECRACIAI